MTSNQACPTHINFDNGHVFCAGERMLHLNCSACFVPGSPDTGNTICLINEKNILLSSNKCVVGVIGCVVVIEEIILLL